MAIVLLTFSHRDSALAACSLVARVARDRWMQESEEVTVDDVRQAMREINEQAHFLAVKDAAPQEKLLILAICMEVHTTGKVRRSEGFRYGRNKSWNS